MLEIAELRSRLRSVSPMEALETLAKVLEDPATSSDFENPIVSIQMRSGTAHRGHLVNHSRSEHGRFFLLSLVITNMGDDGRDIVYLNGADIETVAIYDVDPLIEFLPNN